MPRERSSRLLPGAAFGDDAPIDRFVASSEPFRERGLEPARQREEINDTDAAVGYPVRLRRQDRPQHDRQQSEDQTAHYWPNQRSLAAGNHNDHNITRVA